MTGWLCNLYKDVNPGVKLWIVKRTEVSSNNADAVCERTQSYLVSQIINCAAILCLPADKEYHVSSWRHL